MKTKASGSRGNGRKPNKTSPDLVLARREEITALDLRISGAHYDQMAEAMNCSESTAYRRVQRCLDRVAEACSERASELRQIELRRLDAMFLAVYPDCVRGVYTAIDRALKIMERRARLLGLDAPQKVMVDWREEAKAAGLDDQEAFEQFVELVMTGYANRLGQSGSGTSTSA